MFTTQQQEFATAIEQFCEKHCATAQQRQALTDGGRLSNSPEMLQKFAELGWLGVSLPVEYGGGGAGMVEECIFLEETARGLAPIHAYGTGLTAAQTYLRHGDEQQKKEVLGNLCSGHFEAIALSEPGAGSDLSGVATRAVRDGDRFVVNGQKTWITAAHLADHLLVLTRTDSDVGKHHGLTLLYLPTDSPGLDIRPIQTMDGHTVNDVFFTDVSVPVANVVGGIGDAWHRLDARAERRTAHHRCDVARCRTPLAGRHHRLCAHPRTVRQADRHLPVGTSHHCRSRDRDRVLPGLRLPRRGADRCRVGGPVGPGRLDGQAQVHRGGQSGSAGGLQMMGGAGYTVEYGMEMQVRKALAPPIYGGANAIQREIIGKSFGL